MLKRRSGSVMKTLGSCNLLLLVVVVLCVVYAGAMGNTHTPEHLHQVFGRFLLQANENAETLQRCDQIPGNISAPNCTISDPKQDLRLLQKKPDEDNDDGHKDAVVPASVVAAVVGFTGSFTLVLGYVCYRKDPDKFRKRYGKAMALLPTRHAQRPSEIAALGPPQQAGQLSIGQPSPIVAHVPPPRPPISSGAAVTYGQPRRPEPASMPFTISLTSSSPSTHANRDHPPGSVASAVVDSGFVLPGNVPQVPGPRTVPPPILSFEKDRHPVPAAQGPRPFQLPQHQVEVSHWGQSDLHSFGYPGTNPPDTIVSSVPSQQAAAEPGPRLASGPDHMVGYNGPLRSPFDPPDSIGSSQWDYERQATVDSARQQIDTNSDDMNAGVSPIHQVDHPGLITIPEQACPDLNYDIRVLPLSERPTELGKGTFGTVEPGVFTDSGGNIVHVAVKYGNELFYSKTPKDVLRIFQSELDVMCRVPAHANIVRCYGGRVKFDNEDNIGARDVYIVEELMHANLQDVIHGDDFTGGLPYNLILKIALHIATGLEHLHRSGVLHYDLKPANILVDEDFNAKIADFGASKVKAKSYISGTGFRGTLGYMAPELMLGVFVKHVPINEKIDVYSFGVVLWEMVERQYPPDPLSAGAQNLDGVDQEVLREGINDDRFQLNRRCPEGLRQLIEDCVNLTPAVRPNATEVRERVEVLLAQSQHRTDLTTNVDV